MRCLATALAVLQLVFTGCKSRNEDREALLEFLDKSKTEVLQKNHSDELMKFEGGERQIRYFHATHSDEVRVIDKFLTHHPKLSERSKEPISKMRKAAARLVELHEMLLNNKRFALTEEEKNERSELHAELLKGLNEIGFLIDEKK
jgi:hypothetical protein